MHALQCRNAEKEEDAHYFAIEFADTFGSLATAFVACPECDHVFPYPQDELRREYVPRSKEVIHFVYVTLLCRNGLCRAPVSFYLPKPSEDTSQNLRTRLAKLTFHAFCANEHLLEFRNDGSQLITIEDRQPGDVSFP